METIRNYLDNMFASLPRTARVSEVKSNILANMEEKYNELKAQGKSENEAIGIVISEFGNIDELTSELGLRTEDGSKPLPVVNQDEVNEYLKVKKALGVKIGIGVFLCITGVALLLLITSLTEAGIISIKNSSAADILGLIPLFILITIAVGIFIYSGMSFERYQYMEKGVQVPGNIAEDLKKRYDSYTPVFYAKLIVGVCMIILSPVAIFITSIMEGIANEIGVIILLMIVAAAVYLFITSGVIRESYEHLLQIGDYSQEKKKEDKVISAVAAIVWPLAAAIFLFSGFVYHSWGICWVVFPITGILFGMFCSAYSIIKGKAE